MSKELVISSNSHETKVAVLEDDQLVEIYFQRANEYSLAGSIHKGRVTRVLPGMQSAFVDIGLDRDAFLYVSDFFEDNEEYDKIVTSVEDKVLRLERGVPAAAGPLESAVVTAPAPVAEPVVEPPAPAVIEPQAPPPLQPSAGAEVDDRRGRRSRRRRTRGRGFPESKYAQPAAAPDNGREYALPVPPREEEREPEDDFAVLPGESLAKYSQPGGPEESAEESFREPEPDDFILSVAEDGLAIAETAEAEEPEMPAPGPEEPEIPETDDPPEIQEPVPVEPELPVVPYDPESPDPAPVTETSVAALPFEAESDPALDPGADEDIAPDSDAAEPDEEGEFAPAGAADAAAAGESPEAEEPVEPGDSGPEPARIPTSLTAALREQGGRYLHRSSRRTRRKMRGGEEQQPPRPQYRSEPRPAQPPEPRPQARPDRQDKPERAERTERTERPDRPSAPSIADLLKEGREIIVQVAKEPLGQKGARITSHIALPGRYLVYMPTVDHIGVSRKIASDEERARLKRILQAHRSGIPGGYIVRTAGDGKTEEELRADMMFLYNLWLDMRQRAEKKAAPALIHHDLSLVERVLRDQVTSSFKNIWSDNEEIYESVLGFVQRFQPAMVSRVKLYTRPQSIFDAFNITPELEKALRPKVWLKSGGYIVINQTEALVAIDINTGKYVGKSNRLEDTIVKTNTDAIREIVRQIRLRDLGGIIVVDFIDMDERKNRQKVMQSLEEAMRADRAPYKILQFNDFGLVAITRKRVKQSLERTLCAPCPSCEGSGYVKSPQTVVGEILDQARKMAAAVDGPSVVLRVNPEVAKLLKASDNDFLQEIEGILKCDVLVKSDPLLHQQNFDLA